MLNDTKTLQVF